MANAIETTQERATTVVQENTEIQKTEMSKAEIIRTGIRLGVDYGQTLSCYAADEVGRACGTCDSCRLRLRGFAEAGVEDPTRYRK